MVNEDPGEPKDFLQATRKCPDTKGFGSVVTCQIDVYPPLRSLSVVLVAHLSGNQRIHPPESGLLDQRTPCARHDRHPPDFLRTSRNEPHLPSYRMRYLNAEVIAVRYEVSLAPHKDPLEFPKTPSDRDAHAPGKLRGVADLRMRVEGKMSGVHSRVGTHQQRQLPIAGARHGTRSSPVETMVDEKQVAASPYRLLDRRLTGVDCRRDPVNGALVRDLKSVQDSWIVGEPGDPQRLVQILDDGF